MNHLAVFNGIGGFQIAADWMGWHNVAHVENDAFCNKVVNHWYPNSKQYEDIKQFDGKPWRGIINLITGGFPCQPFSSAGQKKGNEDDRHLWPEMYRIIREVMPQYVVAENVPGIINWNEGLVFDQVITDMEAQGYEVQPVVLPAGGVNAPHIRQRCFFVASYASQLIWNERKFKSKRKNKQPIRRFDSQSNATNTKQPGCERQQQFGAFTAGQQQSKSFRPATQLYESNYWKNFPTEPPIHVGDDGVSAKLDGITFSKLRKESIKAAGNAIVPQVAYQIFKAMYKNAK